LCDLHQSRMNDDTLRISYGTPGSARQEYGKAHREMFPNANSWVGGGCIYMVGESPDYARVRYCTKCRSIESEWLRAHGGIEDRPQPPWETQPEVAR
jgi:hypothetical protein